MYFERSATEKRKRVLVGLAGGAALAMLICFWREIFMDIAFFWAVIKSSVLRFPFVNPPGATHALDITGYVLFTGMGLVFLLWTLAISQQALLPVRSLLDVIRTAANFVLFILRIHGPAVFVRDGQAYFDKEDKGREGPGVFVVDFNSAVVFEERIAPVQIEADSLLRQFLWEFYTAFGLTSRYESPRVRGAGLVFTRPRERLRGVVDLRKQFRIKLKEPSYTRDGIELACNSLALFSVGNEPDILWVTYAGEHRVENLREVNLQRSDRGGAYVATILDDLDPADKREIHHYAQMMEHEVAQRRTAWRPFSWQHPLPPMPTLQERVFAAVFSQARDEKQNILDWTQMPNQVITETYREVMSSINYDDLYGIHSNQPLPLLKYKTRMRLTMRNSGVLSYRLVFLQEGNLTPKRVYREDQLYTSDNQALKNPKPLRNAGIKVLMGSFSDPSPIWDAIYEQRLDAWRARWSSATQVRNAENELNASRAANRAYAEAQREVLLSLRRILNSATPSDYPDEAIAISLMQTLERLAADPETRKLLPSSTTDLLRNVYNYLIPAPMWGGGGMGMVPGSGGGSTPAFGLPTPGGPGSPATTGPVVTPSTGPIP